ncbi:metalloprotease PmbA [Stenotrophomonas maltophilia]|uniref:Metalloprotease PmbA n=1 Tax=Stenotrophomonas maltophilia TaxID=40324 RepID=A0AAI9C071_STEMA|nr:metalloprotease PmbA [Stenotrophomonas maltophilia]AWT15719.1 metalloprotease PmbA [Stenotrophomonas maltophilia]EKT4091837.1 metalloprotease PmbA [Stenotrophomonas maltophilia]MBA0363962.1 metalloprotease PmbA [Stenotrophomonas maltophilia]HEL4103706.1 metalloprotease PmbA [Stenotrophomonas maltophilia]HEL5044003.1 metalloprotease PmbA [Stenotrophomonas maltophilia]
MNVIAPEAAIGDDSPARLERLADLSQQLLDRARALGASQAEVSCSEDRGLEVNVRLGEVETVQSTRDRGIAVTVYFGQRKGSASTGDLNEASLAATVEQACAIARHTEDDPAAGLAEAALMATDFPDLDGWHPWALQADEAVDLALACESAGREADAQIRNSDGASVSSMQSLSVYANSHGFIGRERGTHHSVGCALIAGQGDGMQRDGWYTSALAREDLENVGLVGRRAAERTVARLQPRSMATGSMPVLFAPEVARSLVGHLLSAVSGGALYRQASFLLDSVGQRLFPEWMQIEELPHLRRGLRSAVFDGDGVATRASALVCDGVLQRYVLGSYSARKLGLQTTANAGGVHNLQLAANAGGLQEIARQMGDGLLVTELMGQGVNGVTGDYSRGAGGFRVENGEIQYPVDGITIAGNLREMFSSIEAVGSDVDPRSHIRTGSILLGRMTIAGND